MADPGGVEKRLAKLERLLEVNRELVLELDLDRLLELVVERSTEVMDADRGSLYVVDPERGEIWTRVAQGVGEIRLPLGKGVAGKVAQTGESIRAADAYRVPEFDEAWDRKHGYLTRSLLCVPLRGREGHVIGVFEVLNKREGEFVAEDEDLLVALGAGVAVALENAVLVDELRRANDKVSQAYEQLLLSDRLSMLGLLAGAVAHDIKNPLAVVLSCAELLKLRLPHKAGAMQSATLIGEQVGRISTLVDSIQNYARHASQQVSEVDLVAVLRESLVLTGRLLRKADVEVDWRLAPGLPLAWGNANRLEQVFVNLVQNAAQAMEGGGRLTIEARPDGDDWLEVAVSDTGGGVPAEEADRIFEALFTTRAEGEGTGLGLAICKRIVTEHGGKIELVNRHGEGATFQVRLLSATAQRPVRA